MYPLVRELAADGIPVAVTCRVLKMTRQPYYRWLANPVTDAELAAAYRSNALFDAHRDDPEFGYRFLLDEAREAGEPMAERTAWKYCSDAGWWSAFGKKRGRNGKKPGPPVHDDLCAVVDKHGVTRHEFGADAPNELWLSDITEHWTGEGKLYVCAIKDVWSNRIVGYSIDSRMKSRLAVAALQNAVARRQDVAGCVVHTDRGSQFRSRKFVHALNRHHMVGSMGRVGPAGDNAAMESFFPPAEERPQPPHLGHPGRVADRDRPLDREDLPPPPKTAHARTIDPDRVRADHGPSGHQSGLTPTVTSSCSRPLLGRWVHQFSLGLPPDASCLLARWRERPPFRPRCALRGAHKPRRINPLARRHFRPQSRAQARAKTSQERSSPHPRARKEPSPHPARSTRRRGT